MPREADALVAKSPRMTRMLELAERAAVADTTVLITGESGTGKERVARFIHQRSRRSKQPFVAVNCGALPESLLESELFGHQRGAFTGAVANREGLFEAASGGTLFLDEIGEAPPSVQVKLLRALQEHSVRRVGATKDVAVDVRLLTATNRDLEQLVASGSFRKDLFYRLRVIPLELPPLRERRDDILPLARLFIARTCRENSCGPCALSSEVLDALCAYPWPGNVRELENAIERAVVLAEGQPKIELTDLPVELRERAAVAAQADEPLTLAEAERRHVLDVLSRCEGNRAATARALGIGENTLWRKLKAYGVPAAR
ncbi:MAG: sigma 54-interacting transcriptional regulator [Deltaproteobacteria bacterium]|nr:sigma 54-interacting transcriptional regulator [Deltaproteobacteria bacterium]